MTITSVAAQKALVSGPIVGQLLSELRGSGIVGLGLMVGPLRRPFAAAPLLSVDAWRGVRFRVLDSRLQADAIRSFGAIPLKSGLDGSTRRAHPASMVGNSIFPNTGREVSGARWIM